MVLIFKTRPLLNTMTTYAMLWTVADLNEQKFISKKDKIDLWKSARMTGTGSLVIAPMVFGWLRLAERMLPGKRLTIVAKKVVVEQICFAPLMYLMFYTSTSLLERKSISVELEKKYLKTYKTGLMYWPIVQTVNFSLVPHHYRPVVVAGASFLWASFLCFMKEEERVRTTVVEQEVQIVI